MLYHHNATDLPVGEGFGNCDAAAVYSLENN